MSNSIAESSRKSSGMRAADLELMAFRQEKQLKKVLESMANDVETMMSTIDHKSVIADYLLNITCQIIEAESCLHKFGCTGDATHKVLRETADSKDCLVKIRDHLKKKLQDVPSEDVTENDREASPSFFVKEIQERVQQLINAVSKDQTVRMDEQSAEILKQKVRIEELLRDITRTEGNNEDLLQRYHDQQTNIEKVNASLFDANKRLGAEEIKNADLTARIRQLEAEAQKHQIDIARLEGAREEREFIIGMIPNGERKLGKKRRWASMLAMFNPKRFLCGFRL